MNRKTVDGLVLWAVSLACLAPLLWLAWRGFDGQLGANPIEKIIRNLGVWGLRLLIVGLTITPLSRLLRQPRLIRLRRPIGLFAFGYIVLHLSTYIGVDQYFDWAAIWKDILKRPFITIGMAAFVMLIPMAATSFNAAIRWLGAQRWRGLHRVIYLIAPMGVVHYYLLVKADHRPPLIYGGIVLLLLGYRLIAARRAAR